MPIEIGSRITTVTLTNTSASPLTNAPFTFAQAFKPGDLPSGSAVLLRAPDNSSIPCQIDERVTNEDGSIRHAVLSAIVPSLGASVTAIYGIERTTPAASSPAVPADFTGLDAVVTWTETNATYTASLATLLAGSKVTWLSGGVVSEWEVSAPLKKSDNTEHAHLHARFYVRAYKGQNKARVDVVVENTWAWNPAPQDVTGNVTITVGGNTVYSKTSLVHHPRARYRIVAWWNTTAPTLHVQHDRVYLIATRAIPNYDLNVNPSASQALSYKNATINNGGPMGNGTAQKGMAATGGRPDIGILPGWTALYLISMSRDAKDATLNQGDLAGSWSMHFRDKNTNKVLSLVEWPYYSIIGTSGDNVNPATGQSERAPNTVTNTNPNVPDISHHPDQAYVPYLVTGDIYYLEELQFWAMYCVIGQLSASNYRNGADALVKMEQLRGQAWALRTFAHAAYISPQAKERGEFVRILKSNIDWYDTNYTNNTGDNAKLGIIHHNPYSLNYTMVTGEGVTGLANWQDDHFTAAIGRTAELGFSFAIPLLNYKAKYTVGRLYGQTGVCWIQAAAYRNKVRDTPTSPIYTSLYQCYQATMSPDVIAAAAASNCGTQEMATAWANYNTWATANNRAQMDGVSNPAIGDMDGYSDSPSGYPSCLQQAIAYCATHGALNAVNAWEVFEGRTVKPDYGTQPQFAITPRPLEASAVEVISDNYTIGAGQTMYFGRSAPTVNQGFDSVTFFNATNNNGVPWSAQNGRPLVVDLHGSSGSNSDIGIQYRAQVSGSMAFEGFTEFGYSVAAGSRTINGSVVYHINLRPIDRWVYNGTARESMHLGFRKLSDGRVYLTSERRYDAMMDWALQNLTQYDLKKRVITGGSMGGWGCMTYGLRRPAMFCAVYADRPRWRYANSAGKIAIATLESGMLESPVGSAPLLAAEDGGTNYATHLDLIAYVSNTANKIPPVLWCCGSADGFMPFSDSIAAVAALRAAKRAFAFAWNNGGHATGSIMNQLLDSYPYGTYELGRGYPLFTNHSLDKDPSIDAVGEINGGLSFRNVVENAAGWSCEITSLRGACTVTVEPISDVFKASVTPKNITIPAANTWVPVSFSA